MGSLAGIIHAFKGPYDRLLLQASEWTSLPLGAMEKNKKQRTRTSGALKQEAGDEAPMVQAAVRSGTVRSHLRDETLRKLIICFESMIWSFKNMIHSKRICSLLQKYDSANQSFVFC